MQGFDVEVRPKLPQGLDSSIGKEAEGTKQKMAENMRNYGPLNHQMQLLV